MSSQMDTTFDIGIVEQRQKDRELLKRLRPPVVYQIPKVTVIEVNCKTGERTVREGEHPDRMQREIDQRAQEILRETIERLAQARAAKMAAELGEVRQISGPSVREIIKAVGEATGVDVYDILGPKRSRKFSRPRQLSIWLIRHIRKDLSFPSIAMAFRQDHTSSMYSVYKIGELLKQRDPHVTMWLKHPALADFVALLPEGTYDPS